MSKYRKKPVVIEAEQITLDNFPDVAEWCGGAKDIVEKKPVILIATLEGKMTAQTGDYVIQGVKGEFYPCKPDIFEATYEPAHPEIGRRK